MGLFNKESKQMNIMLDEEDLKCLLRGGILTVNKNLRIALKDIGFMKIQDALISAEDGIDIGKSRDRESNDGKGW